MHASVVSVLAMASSVSAHALMYGVWVNGVDQGDGQSDYIRSPPNNNPVKDLASSDIACNVNGATAAPNFVSAAAGDEMSFEWYHNTRDDDIIDGSHKGPVITYIAPYTEGMDGTGAIWTKIAEEGLSGTTWAVDNLKTNHGLADFTIPASLAPGQYLFRQEIIAHHESEVSFVENPARGAQFYPSCVQVEITSGGSAVPDQNWDFNTDYTYEDPGIVGVNVYGTVTSYTIPGPAVWTGSGSGSAPAPAPEEPEESAPAPAPTSAPAPTAAPAPTSTAVVPPPASTLSTVISPAPTPSSAPVTPPPTQCRKKRSLKSRKAKKAKRASRL